MFADRADAGGQLAARLEGYRGQRPVVCALPRGGVPVGFEIAQALQAPLDLIFARKIGAPGRPELAVAAIANGRHPETVVNPDIVDTLGLDDSYISAEGARELEEIARRRKSYLGERARVPLADRAVIVVDDGIATGATMRAALRSARHAAPATLVLAVPVAPPDSLAMLEPEVDAVVCLNVVADFGALSLFYDDFHQVPDAEVVTLLKSAERP